MLQRKSAEWQPALAISASLRIQRRVYDQMRSRLRWQAWA
jgi:hypothetical protein